MVAIEPQLAVDERWSFIRPNLTAARRRAASQARLELVPVLALAAHIGLAADHHLVWSSVAALGVVLDVHEERLGVGLVHRRLQRPNLGLQPLDPDSQRHFKLSCSTLA
jgi:hypothetical protein